MPVKAHSTPRGFSLVEVLIALIVISVGLLGIAKLEALMLSGTGTSRLRSLVALQGESLAASMHANRDYWDNSANGTFTLTGTQTTGTTAWTGTPAALATKAGAPPSCQESSPGTASPPTCAAPQDMAAFDLSQWAGSGSGTTATGMAAVLQNSVTTIGCAPNAAANNVVTCTITITWTEKTIAANTQEQQAGAPTAFQGQTYTLVIEP
ncbi:MAG TPA: prepilin-type N-terminal cleavage/methylation domain-containing protein [Steroidobacteraceae bacterium]|jgi:type IV pilus assembly protein PilV